MAAIESNGPRPNRPRPWLLVLLGMAIVAFVASRMFSGAAIAPSVSTTPAPVATPAQGAGKVEPSELDVKLEALNRPAPAAGVSERNPFRFKPPPPPPPPPPVTKPVAPPVDPNAPPPPPPIPPITIKFIGVVETAAGRVGAFTDCRATFPGREGEVIEGRYRIVRIGIESAVVEYRDGKGRTTLPLNGQAQACIGK